MLAQDWPVVFVLMLLATPLIAATALLVAKTASDLRLLIRERSAV